MTPRHFKAVLCVLLGLVGVSPSPAALTAAAAANLVYVLDAIKVEFNSAHPGVALEIVTGASGSLFAQIKAGAPYDLYLAADVDYPRQLIAADLADSATLTIFARGRLVFWSNFPGPAESDLGAALRDPRMKKVALANPRNAPYGRAAIQVLERLGEWVPDSARWVYGENISQTAQFVESGNADGGFVARSLVLSPRLKGKARFIEIPESWHAPLDHAAVITRRGKDNPDARLFLQFLGGPAARRIFATFGYSVPE